MMATPISEDLTKHLIKLIHAYKLEVNCFCKVFTERVGVTRCSAFAHICRGLANPHLAEHPYPGCDCRVSDCKDEFMKRKMKKKTQSLNR
jgi:hypothetical protein